MYVLEQVYSKHFQDKSLEQAPTTPGMKYRHYSPDAPVILIDPAGWRDCEGGSTSAGSTGSTGSSGSSGYTVVDGDLMAEAVRRSALSEVRQLVVSLGASGGRVALLRTTAVLGTVVGLVPVDNKTTDNGDDGTSGFSTMSRGNSASVSSSSVEVVEVVLGCRGDSESVAREMFSALRRMDELRVAAIVVEGVAEEGAGMAVMNRLRKAASRLVPL